MRSPRPRRAATGIRRLRVAAGTGAALAMLIAPSPSAAQVARPVGATRPLVATNGGADSASDRLAGAFASGSSRRPAVGSVGAPWWAPVASAMVPGAGQAVMHQDRFVAFLAVESYGWVRYVADIEEGRRERRAYRSLADRVARALFSERRPQGDFEYYERMEHFLESGVFDAVPGGALDPEVDEATFNGFVWLQARQTFWERPDQPPPSTSESYLKAVAFYEQRAIRPEYRWSWRDAQLEQDLYRRTISHSNSAFRRSGQDLAVILANHALSTVDAYVTVRIRRHAAAGESTRIEAQLPWPRRR